jgi:hypothetical protein
MSAGKSETTPTPPQQRTRGLVHCWHFTRVPPWDDKTVAFVKELLSVFPKGHNVEGFVLTGFDDNHYDAVGTSIVLRKYRPDWVMYPTYYKKTQEAKKAFALVDEEEALHRATPKPPTLLPTILSKGALRTLRLADPNRELLTLLSQRTSMILWGLLREWPGRATEVTCSRQAWDLGL